MISRVQKLMKAISELPPDEYELLIANVSGIKQQTFRIHESVIVMIDKRKYAAVIVRANKRTARIKFSTGLKLTIPYSLISKRST